MKLSLPRLFKKEKSAAVAVSAPPPPVEKPASERFGKTVMPNAGRTSEPAPAAAPLSSAPRLDSLGESRLSFSAPKHASSEATHAPGERTVALQLAELLPQIPAELLGKTEVDPECRVSFNATELERGMANGRPVVLLRSIYQQAPTIFAMEVRADDPREIALPFQQVLQQFASLQPRDDQECDEPILEIETALSRMTVEDNKRFGVVPPPAALRAKTPEPVAVSTPAPVATPQVEPPTPIRLPIRLIKSAPAAAAPSSPPPQPEQPPKRTSVKVRFSPNGTGVPATERVPASSGSPVPTPLPSPFAPPPPARIPFKVTPPASDLCPPPVLPKKTADSAKEGEPFAFSTEGPRLRLPLRAVLRGLLPFQFTGSIEQVPESAVLEMPFAIVQPQLALGRVAISPAQFAAALPEEFRSLFKVDEDRTPVPLPLPEVLQNLPNETLKLRGDQEDTVVAQVFETPFSQKAAEDAARMNVPAGPIAKGAGAVGAGGADPGESEVTSPNVLEVAEQPGSTSPAPPRTPLQVALDTDDAALDAKAVVAHASRLPGVSACAIVFSDGLSLAGNIPAEYEADALCGIAPEIFKRIADQMISAHFGALEGITLFCAKRPVSFFAHGNICLAALHSAGELAIDIRERLARTTEELACIYAQPA